MNLLMRLSGIALMSNYLLYKNNCSALLRFVLVGIFNSLFGYTLFAVLVWLGFSHYISIGAATVCGVIFNFYGSKKLVFINAGANHFGRFLLVYCLIYGVNVGAVAILLSLNVNIYVANALMLPVLALTAFFLQNKFVFGKL